MTLPTSGALSLNDIKGEFGGPTSPSLGDYYAGGTYVAAGTSGTNGAVPSSGAISISNFYGTGVPVISITDQTLDDEVNSPGSSSQAYRLNSNGKAYSFNTAGTAFIEDWVTPNGAAANYECYVTVTSGTLTTGTTGSWLALSSTNEWKVERATVGLKTCTFTVDIRKVGTGTVLDSATITINATVTP